MKYLPERKAAICYNALRWFYGKVDWEAKDAIDELRGKAIKSNTITRYSFGFTDARGVFGGTGT